MGESCELSWLNGNYSVFSCAQENACLGIKRGQNTALASGWTFSPLPNPLTLQGSCSPHSWSLSWSHSQKHVHWLPTLFTASEVRAGWLPGSSSTKVFMRMKHTHQLNTSPASEPRDGVWWVVGKWDDRPHCLLFVAHPITIPFFLLVEHRLC